ncbi:MAG TPA: acyl-CoA thioester hydrolase/BAAT C-terminal domain-containing protein [Candidatus Acidoferrales bacterium]
MPQVFSEPFNAVSGRPTLLIEPPNAFVDEEIAIVARGFRPGARVTLSAETRDDLDRAWESEAHFFADGAGGVDARTQKSLDGTYRGVSAMGLFWSMRLIEPGGAASSTFAKTTTEPNRVQISAQVEGEVVSTSAFERRFLAPGTMVRDLTIDGADANSAPVTVGRLFVPPGVARPPVVVVLSGSGGGFDVDKAAVLSRHGFATFALAYFGIDPLPSWLHRIPLEYFESAIAWLGAQPEIDAERVGILGVSRGAELALLVASSTPTIRAVVAYAPSSVAWAASGRDKATGELIPCWTRGGQPIPFAPLPLRGFMLRSAFPVAALKRPVLFRNLFRAGLRNRRAAEHASIPVENMSGALLLVSGGDDHLWPAAEMSERIVSRLKKKAFAHAVEHLHYPEAGHMLRYPFLPTTPRVSSNKHLRGAKFSFGGNPEADAAAQEDAWRRAITFLQQHL